MVSVKVMSIVPALFLTVVRFLYRARRDNPDNWQLSPRRLERDAAGSPLSTSSVRANFPVTPTASAWLTYYTLMAFWHEEAGPADQLFLLGSMLGTSWFGFLRVNTKATPLIVICHVLSRVCAMIIVAVAFVKRDGKLFQEVAEVANVRDRPFRLSVVLMMRHALFWRASLWSACIWGWSRPDNRPSLFVPLILLWVLPLTWAPKVPETKYTDVYLLIPLARWNDITQWIAILATVEIVCALPVLICYEWFVTLHNGELVDDEPRVSVGQGVRALFRAVDQAGRHAARQCCDIGLRACRCVSGRRAGTTATQAT
jgi:hypothetical protein